MKISRHHSRVLDELAHGAMMDIAHVLAPHIGPLTGERRGEMNGVIRELIRAKLGKAWDWGVSYKDAQPDELPVAHFPSVRVEPKEC